MKRYCTIAFLLLFSVLIIGCISFKKVKQKPFQRSQNNPVAVDGTKTKGVASEDKDDDELYDVGKDSVTNQRLGINKEKDQNDIDFDLDDEE